MPIELKTFQKNTLAVLAKYLEQARLTDDPQGAFMAVARDPHGRVPIYRRVPGLENVPYVCLRLPTGGGKTIIAAHAIRTAARSYIEKEFPVVLWLVPTNTIRTQTADALKNTAHSYRQALDDAFEGRVAVFDIADIEDIRPADLADRVCVIVGTIQTLRVEKTEGRDVYAHKEALESHFTRLPTHVTQSGSTGQSTLRQVASEGSRDATRDASAQTAGLSMTADGSGLNLERFSDGPNAGQVKYSFANLMSIHRPLVIVDEAHNARTGLTFDVLKRVAPSCIIELTATPDTDPRTGSNILHRVSASELKAEALIKLPIVLTEHPTGWQDAVRDALLTRARLAELAAREPDYIRPLLLIQAENRDKPANVEAVKQYLIEDEKIAADRIAIATGDQRELDGINLFDPTCPIEVIITVQALKEGWDCSFAYVFCSTANISASRDVEQLLGRVLRMPYARRRGAPDLNKAYAHVASAHFGQAARELEDSLVNRMGFEETEAAGAIEGPPPPAQAALFDDLPLFQQPSPVTLTVDRPPDLSGLSPEEQAAVTVREIAAGNVQVELRGEITPALAERLEGAVPESLRPVLREQVAEYHTSRGQADASARRARFAVPRLCVYVQGELELAERELFLDAAGWNLLDCPAELADFHFNDAAKTFEFDVDGSRVVYQFKGDQQLELPHVTDQWTVNGLVRWLDGELRQPDVRQEVLQRWLLNAITYLLDRKRFDLPALARAKFILVRALGDKIRVCRENAAQRGYQAVLFGPQAAVETSYDYEFRYEPGIYPANNFCRSGYRWQRHFYPPAPGELAASGEEFECAQTLDLFPAVTRWVRNLERQPDASFWLPTATDRFYPDFVAELNDGRLLVVEYKGALTAQTADTAEKRLIGEKWEAASAGHSLFLIAEKRDPLGRGVYEQLQAKIGERRNP